MVVSIGARLLDHGRNLFYGDHNIPIARHRIRGSAAPLLAEGVSRAQHRIHLATRSVSLFHRLFNFGLGEPTALLSAVTFSRMFSFDLEFFQYTGPSIRDCPATRIQK